MPADDFLATNKAHDARRRLEDREKSAGSDFIIRDTKIGGTSRVKILAEVMDAHLREDIRTIVDRYFSAGADIVDLGFGFDAEPADVTRVFSEMEGIERPLAADTQDPDLILAALCRADLVLSLQERNIPEVGKAIADAGAAAVVVPGERLFKKEPCAGKKKRDYPDYCGSFTPAGWFRSRFLIEKFQKITVSAFLRCG